jgi:DNA-binding NarL/FixJ family response regulator
VIALTTFDTDDHIFGAIKAGAGGFLLKDVDADGLHIAIRTVAAGDGVLDPAVTGRVLADLAERSARQPIAPERLDLLTDREREVLKLATKGLTNAQSRRSWS